MRRLREERRIRVKPNADRSKVEYRPIADAEVFREPLRIIGNRPSSDDLRQFAGFRKGGSDELYRIAFRKQGRT
jgi:hypothetical protein